MNDCDIPTPMDFIKSSDMIDTEPPITFTCKELKHVRELIGWRERLLVWLFRVTFMVFLFAFGQVKDKQLNAAIDKIKVLEARIEAIENANN